MRRSKRLLAIFLTASMITAGFTPMSVYGDTSSMSVGELKVNYLQQPLGIDEEQPAFSWKLSSDDYGKGQSAYRVVVSSTKEKAEAHEGDMWDSGKQSGEYNYDVVYSGASLESRTLYYWSVQVWDEDGYNIGFSEISSFETGIMDTAQWKGDWVGIKNSAMNFQGSNWIWRVDSANQGRIPAGTQFFRKSFIPDGDKTINSVYIGITADDEYEFFVNGRKVGENGGVDSWKNGKLYDITGYVDAYKETVVAVSANNTSSGYAGLLAKVEISYSDNTKDTYVTDGTWKLSKTQQAGWWEPDYQDSQWILPDQIIAYGQSPWGQGVAPNAENAFAATVLRKEFKADGGAIKRARAYVSGLGFFEMKINGALPDDTVLNPANTQYTQTVLYRVFDVTSLIKEGDNAIGIELGNNFYNETCSVWDWQSAAWRDAPKLLMELEIEYENGQKVSIVSDDTWKATKEGPTTSNSIYYGDTYDARKELTGYDQPGFNDSNWGQVQLMDAPAGKLKAQIMEPIRRTKEMQPTEIKKLENGSYVLVIPEMLAGWIKLTIRGAESGDKVTITYGEKLKSDGQVQKLGGADGVNSNWWPMAYNQQDNYICKGEAVEIFEPKFSYKGYQYVQIDGYPSELALADIICYRTSNDMEITGQFNTSNALLNKMHVMMMTTMSNNMQGKPTDTPVWEKNGWLGDANVGLSTMTYNYNFANMLTLFTETMEDCLRDFGNVPNMVPTQGWGNDNSVVWNSIFVFGVDQMLSTYGFESYISEQYDAMRILALKDINESRRNGWTWSDGQLADWVSPMGQGEESMNLPYNESPSEGSGIAGTGFAYHLLDVMAQLADRLGKSEDAEEYREAMTNIYKAFNEKFYDPERQIYETKTWSQIGKRERYRQTSQLVPLAFGLVPEEYREGVLLNLVKDIKNKNYHLDTGCVGSKLILPVLSENGYSDVAYKIALQETYPSWGFMAERGTSLWEMWETTSRSLGHYFLGTYDEWFYSGIGGIKNIKEGYKTFVVEPLLGGDLTYANTSIETVRGTVTSNWTYHGQQAEFHIQIPVGSTATIILPADTLDQIICNGTALNASSIGIQSAAVVDGKVQILAGSGTYQFTSEVKINTLDKLDLKIAINKAKALHKIDYENDAWAAFTEVINQAIAVRDDSAVKQAAVDEMAVKVEAAILELVNHINQSRAALKELVAATAQINPMAHPSKIVAEFNEIFAAAKAGCIEEDITNEELGRLKTQLEQVITELNNNVYENYALGKNITALTSHEDSYWGWGKQLMTDGDRKNSSSNGEYTGYSSTTGIAKDADHQEWVYVDLGVKQAINNVTIYPATQTPGVSGSCYGFPKTFEFQVSDNGEDWITVYRGEDYPIPDDGPLGFSFDLVEARYVKLNAKNLNPKVTDHNYYYLQLTEFEVYNNLEYVDQVNLSAYDIPEDVIYGELLYGEGNAPEASWSTQKITGQWSAEDENGNKVNMDEKQSVGNYNINLTFEAPTRFVFTSELEGTAEDGATVSVQDNGKRLIYTYSMAVKKAEALEFTNYTVYFSYVTGGTAEVNIAKLVESLGPITGYRLGEIEDLSSILGEPAPMVDSWGILTFAVDDADEADLCATIPVIVSSKNFNDIPFYVMVVLTDKIPITITSEAADQVYTGEPYSGLGIPTAKTTDGETYTGGFTVIYHTDDGREPVHAGTYQVTIIPEDVEYAGEWNAFFTIEPKEIEFKALSRSIDTGANVPALNHPQEGIDFKISGMVNTDIFSGTVTMNYLNVNGEPCEPDNKTAGKYLINIFNADTGTDYVPIYLKGTLTIISRGIISSGGTAANQPSLLQYPSSAGSSADWRKDQNGWWLETGKGSYAKSEWKLIDGKWYFFDPTGYMAQGWRLLNGKWYYLKSDGAMMTGWLNWENNWYYLKNPSGDMAVNMVTPDNYRVGQNGVWIP